jgi:ribosomal protein S18 acetylase RimI-like enzyme
MIGPATPGDVSATIALWEACGLTRTWNDPRVDFAQAEQSDASTILLAREEGAVAGSVMVGFDGHRGWVYYLAVAEAHRRKGLGRALMEAAEAWLVAREAPKIQLMIRADNAAMRGFYDALGYAASDVTVLGKRLDGRAQP